MLVLQHAARVSKTPLDFVQALDAARKIHGRVAIREHRSHASIRTLVAALGLAVRAARNNPVAVDAECIKQGIRAVRLEVRIAGLVVGKLGARAGDSPGYAMRD